MNEPKKAKPVVDQSTAPWETMEPITTRAQLQAAMRWKIDSREKFDKILQCAGLSKWITSSFYGSEIQYYGGERFGQLVCAYHGRMHLPLERWWALREQMRFGLEIYSYPPFDELGLNWPDGHSSMYLHMSLDTSTPDNASRVAWTASIEDGEQDRQRVASVTKYLRAADRHWKHKDSWFRDVEAALRAAMDPTLILLPYDQIYEGYMKGPSSCMSKTSNAYGLPSNLHPVMAYQHPGWQLAVVGTEEHGYSQRALCWTNPENPEDKRYLRIYGSGPLARRLELNGFKVGSPVGAILKAIPVNKDDPDFVLAPYLDANGGGNGGVAHYLRISETELKVIDAETYNKCQGNAVAVKSVYSGSFTSGKARMKVFVDEVWTCAISGKEFRSLEAEPTYALIDGALVRVETSAMMAHFQSSPVAARTTLEGDVFVVAYAAYSTKRFTHGANYWFDTAENRVRCGYVQPDAEWYGTDVWCRSVDVETVLVDGVERRALLKDIVLVYRLNDDGELRMTREHVKHAAGRKALRKTTLVQGRPALVDRRLKPVQAIMSSDGTTAARYVGVHNIVQADDGQWGSPDFLNSRTWFGREYKWFGDARPRLVMDDAAFDRARNTFASWTGHSSSAGNRVVGSVFQPVLVGIFAGSVGVLRNVYDRARYGDEWRYVTFDSELGGIVTNADMPLHIRQLAETARAALHWTVSLIQEYAKATVDTDTPYATAAAGLNLLGMQVDRAEAERVLRGETTAVTSAPAPAEPAAPPPADTAEAEDDAVEMPRFVQYFNAPMAVVQPESVGMISSIA